MDALVLLNRAERAGLRVVLDGDALRVHGPKDAAGIVDELRRHKDDIIAAWWSWQSERLLGQVRDDDTRQDLADLFDDIAASREYELDHHRQDAEHVAFGALIAAMLARGLTVRCSIEREHAR